MAILPSQDSRVREDLDIPINAATLIATSTVASDTSEVVVTAGSVQKVTSFFMTNRLTMFEELIIAITNGYASSGRSFNTDEEFAASACALARSIAYERNKYSNA